MNADQLLKNSVELKIAGVIRPVEDAANATISTPVAYTSKLTNYIIEYTNKSAVVLAQEETPETNILNGMNFEALNDEEKIDDAKKYISAMGISDNGWIGGTENGNPFWGLVSTFKVEAYDTVPKVFYSVPSPIANDGAFCGMSSLPWGFCNGRL